MWFRQEKSADTFWQDFEEQTGEQIVSRGLGKYISGWEEFDQKNFKGLWGLLINTSGGFRFHSFPQYSWFDSFIRFTEKDPPKEKTFFIPKEKITSTQIIKEEKWWKRIFSSSVPHLIILYADENGAEKRLVFETEYNQK